MKVTFIDWDKECELLKAWLNYRIETHIFNLIYPAKYLEIYRTTGVLFYDATEISRPPNLSFEKWKQLELKDNGLPKA